MTLDNMASALQELKKQKDISCYTKEPMGVPPYCTQKSISTDARDVMTDDLIENLITLVEFVEELPSNLKQCKEKIRSVSYDNDLFDGAINQGLDRAIGCVDDFVNQLENPEVKTIEAQNAVEYCNNEYNKER